MTRYYTPNELAEIEKFINRARKEDEPFVVKVFEWIGWKAKQGTTYEDWLHIDIHTYRNGKYVKVDVKRNSKSYKFGKNFIFTIRNGKFKEFPFEHGAEFAFIDENTNTILLVDQKLFEHKFGNRTRHTNTTKLSQYIIVPKNELRNICHTEIKNIPREFLNILK